MCACPLYRYCRRGRPIINQKKKSKKKKRSFVGELDDAMRGKTKKPSRALPASRVFFNLTAAGVGWIMEMDEFNEMMGKIDIWRGAWSMELLGWGCLFFFPLVPTRLEREV